jgi:hypothetical protein
MLSNLVGHQNGFLPSSSPAILLLYTDPSQADGFPGGGLSSRKVARVGGNVRVTSKTKSNGGIYFIQLIYQLLSRSELILVNLKRRLPLIRPLRITDFKAQWLRLFHIHTWDSLLN